MNESYRLRTDASGKWAAFRPAIGAWNDESLSIDVGADGAGELLLATARPTSTAPADAPVGPGVFALRWFETAIGDADEFVALSAAAWPEFEGANPGTQIFGLFRRARDEGPLARLLLCTRYPSLAGWETSRNFVNSDEFRRRHALTRRTTVSMWLLR